MECLEGISLPTPAMQQEAVGAVFKGHSNHQTQLLELQQMAEAVMPPEISDCYDVATLVGLLENVVTQETGSMVVSRQMVTWVLGRLEGQNGAMIPAPTSVAKAAYLDLLKILKRRGISYEEQIAIIRLKLADILEAEGDMLEAASVLSAIPLSSNIRIATPPFKVAIYLRIALLHLQGGNAEEAEQGINRASMYIQTENVKLEPSVCVEHKALHARILERRRRFQDAAQKFHELSLSANVSSIDRHEALSKAITCTILEQPGSLRTRLLNTLYKDERSKELKVFGLLNKLYLDRIIKKDEFAEFEKELPPHQLQDDKGDNIIRKMLIEHNLMAASRVYSTMTLANLANILDVDAATAEKVAARLITSDRLIATMDQVNGTINFQAKNTLQKWDGQLGDFCEQLSRVYDAILEAHPEFVASLQSKP